MDCQKYSSESANSKSVDRLRKCAALSKSLLFANIRNLQTQHVLCQKRVIYYQVAGPGTLSGRGVVGIIFGDLLVLCVCVWGGRMGSEKITPGVGGHIYFSGIWRWGGSEFVFKKKKKKKKKSQLLSPCSYIFSF